ncbi:5-azacytidine-induced protein 2 [Denticeps clupeoides]|uniref:5-azacytidine-induced protein 2 n=1 Tax=Denticeps clupeoides TaxID=299321 RepID=A0AAY4A263_9TELE|nr:5-azacytidine-induced protein 2 [Denticeps clupeoides]
MEPLVVDDDICILKHETAYGAAESPVSVCAGDESVASHFALVTAYEDIKKRLRDTERENMLLRKRVKQLEDKLFRHEAPPSEGPQYVNKAFSAYRGIYIEKEDLQMELNKVKKEKSESEKHLNEQLQTKELEILQLRSELETSQVMRNLNNAQDNWEVEKVTSELKIHALEEELGKVQLECRRLQEKCVMHSPGKAVSDGERMQDGLSDDREASVMKSYGDLCSEMAHLLTVAKLQKNLLRKLRDKPIPSVNRRAASTVPVQCLDDVEKNQTVRVTVPRPPSAPPIPSSSGRSAPPVSPPVLEGLREDCWQGPCPIPRPAPLGSPAVTLPPPQRMGSLDDSSWSFPSPPRPNDVLFWEGTQPKSPNADWAQQY